MFTGIIEDMGTVVGWSETGPGQGWVLTIQPDHPKLFFSEADAQTYLGASIAISGVCLTVTAFRENTLEFGVAPETIRRTNFGDFQVKVSRVNLERATMASARNSGHYVQGHVDGVGQVLERWQEKESLWFKIGVSSELAKGIVEKGFIAVEGTSLTVCDVHSQEPAWFSLMLIDHTQKHVVLPQRQVGQRVNLECDVMAKYASSAVQEVRKSMEAMETRMASTIKELENRVIQLEEDLKNNKRVKV